MIRSPGRNHSWLLGLLVAGGCASVPVQPPAAVPPTVIQVLHRNARDGAGRLMSPALGDLADRAIMGLSGASFPIDGWAWLSPRRQTPVVITVPRSSLLAQVVLARLKLASKNSPRLLEWKAGDPRIVLGSGETPAVLIFHPEDGDGGGLEAVFRDALGPLEGVEPVVLVDLLEMNLPGGLWQADEVLAAENPQAAACAARLVMATRNDRHPPAPETLGGDCAALMTELRWERVGVSR